MTPKFHPRLAGAGSFPEAWAVGTLHVQTPVPLQMSIPPWGLSVPDTLLPVPPQCTTPAGACVQVLGTPGGYKHGGHSVALPPSPGTPQGHYAGSVQLGLSTKRAAALPGSSLGCWEEQKPWGLGHVPGAVLHCSLCPVWVGAERGGQYPTPGATACPITLALPRDPLVAGRGGWAAG